MKILFISLLLYCANNALSFSFKWVEKSSRPVNASMNQAISFNGNIYIFGGYNGTYLSDAHKYNPLTDEWVNISPLPSPRNSAGCILFGEKIYIIGGSDASASPHDDVWEYDVLNDTYIPKAAKLTSRHAFGATIYDNKIYCFGGSVGTLPEQGNTIEVYDVANDTWVHISTMPWTWWDGGCCTIEDKIYLIGGAFDGVYVATVAVYTPATDSWELKSPMPARLNHFATGVICPNAGGKIICVVRNYAEIYDVANDSWSLTTPLSVPRGEHLGSVVCRGALYVIGGKYEGNFVGVTEMTKILESKITCPSVTTVYDSLPTISGTADGVALIEAVEISIKNESDGTYWDGSSWVSTQTYLLANGTTIWSYVSPPWEHEKLYVISSRAIDIGANVETFDISKVSFTFIITPFPEPVSEFRAAPLNNRKIKLEWKVSTSPDVKEYNIYWDSGTGTIDYSAPLATVQHPTTYWISSPLEIKTYKFGIRTEKTTGREEKNENIIVMIKPVESVTGVKIGIEVPYSGQRLFGNSLTIIGYIISGEISDIKFVRFDYKAYTSVEWKEIGTDYSYPYFVNWDTSMLLDGKYDLRAVGFDMYGNPDISPVSITVSIDQTSPDIEETISAEGITKRQLIDTRRDNVITLAERDKNNFTKVIFPKDSIDVSTTIVKIVINPSNIPKITQPEIIPANEYRDIAIESGQIKKDITIIIPYKDENNDTIVDNTNIYESRLNILCYNPKEARWKKIANTIVDKSKKQCSILTSHLSLFGLFSFAATDLSNVLIYPNPYVPYDGDDDNGKPYNPSDETSGIIFANLPPKVSIKIFSITGELIREIEKQNIGGVYRWDVRNSDGIELESGGYIVVIKSNGKKIVRKIGIIR